MKKIAFFLLCASLLHAEIFKIDEEDMRNLRASDPLTLLTLPPKYAFSQAAQWAHEQGYRYFAIVSYECTFGSQITKAQLDPPSTAGSAPLIYEDDWIRIELLGYFDPPDSLDVFDAYAYTIYLCDTEIDLDDDE